MQEPSKLDQKKLLGFKLQIQAKSSRDSVATVGAKVGKIRPPGAAMGAKIGKGGNPPSPP